MSAETARAGAGGTARAVRPWLAPLLLVVMAGTAGTNSDSRPAMGLALLCAGLACLPVLVATRSSALPLLVNAGAVATYLALELAPGPVFLTVPLTTLVVALGRGPRAWVPWSALAVGVVAVGGLSGLLRGEPLDAATGWPLVGVAALVACAGAVATTVRVRAEERAQRTERAAVEERLRMAQDLHDGVGHGLAVVAMQAGVALHVLDRDPEAVRASLEAIRDTSQSSLGLLREELSRLSAAPGAAAARSAKPGLAELPAVLERVRRGGLEVDLHVVPPGAVEDLTVPAALGTVAHRVVQESLTNVLRHAGARRATVALRVAGGAPTQTLEVEVLDDGGGPGPAPGVGLGIAGMRARVEHAGGTFEAGARPGGGYRVACRLPVREPHEAAR